MSHNYAPLSRRILTTSLALCGFVVGTFAQTTWTGAPDGVWHEAGNWSNGLPGAGNPASIPVGAQVDVIEALEAFSVVNAGTITLSARAEFRGDFANRGVVRAGGQQIRTSGRAKNTGEIYGIGRLDIFGEFVNSGSIVQTGGGQLLNMGSFRNEGLIENVELIKNNKKFFNAGRISNGPGGKIENNSRFENIVDGHISNLYLFINKAELINRGFFENGVSFVNEASFRNYGFLSNVGDILNKASGTLYNEADKGVIDNGGSGIFTNEGLVVNFGELNNFVCGVLVNNNLIENHSWISNDGLFFQNGTVEGKPLMGTGPVAAQGGTSSKICQAATVTLDDSGEAVITGSVLATARFDSCEALTYLIDGKHELKLTCADLGTREVLLTLRDRGGNEIECGASLTVIDERAPTVEDCPEDISVTAGSVPTSVNWAPPVFEDCNEVTVTSTAKPGDKFAEGSTAVTYVGTDKSGNTVRCAFTVTVVVEENGCPSPKDDNGLVLYYGLTEGDGKYVLDRAGYGNPLHAKNENTHEITWDRDCGLTNVGHSIVKTPSGANNVGDALKMSNALTLEVWVKSSGTHQNGPARILTYSENTAARNFTIGQENDKFVVRLKTTETDGNGRPARETEGASVRPGEVQHVVFTRDARGNERMYVDGKVRYRGHVGGDFSTWGSHCHLALFNEMTLDRAFKGSIKKVAIYRRAWSEADVTSNFERGACCGDDSPRDNTCEGARGRVTYERYEDIGGWDLPWLYKSAKFPAHPDVAQKLTRLDIPRDAADYYGSRTRGFVYPTTSGNYQFAVSGDDQTRLLFSPTAGDPARAFTIAKVNGFTDAGDLHKFDTQKSRVLKLEAGKAYYFELHHKDGNGGDHASVYWRKPGKSHFEIIGATHLGDVEQCGEANEPEEEPAVVCNREILFVVGNGHLNHGDARILHRLEKLGYSVMVKDALWADADVAAGKGLVIISSTVYSNDVSTKFRDVAVPVMTWESYLYDDMGMTAGGAGHSYGAVRLRRVVVNAGGDVLAAGKAGKQDVYNWYREARWGDVSRSDAHVVAHVPHYPHAATVFAYDAGDRMAGGMDAPAVRIGFYLDDNGASCWTDYGRELFDAAVQYATNCEDSAGGLRENAPTDNLNARSALALRQSDVDQAESRPQGSLQVYPNPAVDRATIAILDFGSELVHIDITDQFGRLVRTYSADANGAQLDVNVAELPGGMYSVVARSGERSIKSRLLVARR